MKFSLSLSILSTVLALTEAASPVCTGVQVLNKAGDACIDCLAKVKAKEEKVKDAAEAKPAYVNPVDTEVKAADETSPISIVCSGVQVLNEAGDACIDCAAKVKAEADEANSSYKAPVDTEVKALGDKKGLTKKERRAKKAAEHKANEEAATNPVTADYGTEQATKGATMPATTMPEDFGVKRKCANRQPATDSEVEASDETKDPDETEYEDADPIDTEAYSFGGDAVTDDDALAEDSAQQQASSAIVNLLGFASLVSLLLL
jgi:hypothetical protein